MRAQESNILTRAKAVAAKYYNWAGGLSDRRVKLGAQLLPPVLILWLVGSVFGGGASETRSRGMENENYGDRTTGIGASIEDRGEYIETVPYSIKRSGLDFENVFSGSLFRYQDEQILTGNYTYRCGASAPVTSALQNITYIIPNSGDQLTIEVLNATNCFGQKSNRPDRYTMPFSISEDGTIRADAIEPSDGSVIVKDALVATPD